VYYDTWVTSFVRNVDLPPPPAKLHVVISEDHNTYSVMSSQFVPCRFQGNIKMDLEETGCEGMDWIHLAQHMAKIGKVV